MFRRSPHQCVSKWLWPCVLSLTVTIFCALSSQGQTNDPSVAGPTLLELAKPIIRPLAGGQIEQFQIELTPSQYAKLNVEQRGIDVVVRVLDPDAKLLTESDADPRLTGTETAEIAVERGGAYTVRVEPRQRSAAAGSFEIVMTDLRGAVSSDLLLDEARRLLTAANALWRSGRYDEALPLAVKARDIRQKELGVDNADYAQALFVVANITGDMGDFTTAAETYKKAIAIREKVVGKDHISMTPLLNNYAVLLKDHGDYPQAEELLQRVLEIRTRELPPNHLLTASVLNNIASISRIKGDDAKAAELYGRVLKIRESSLPPNHPDIATTLNNIANLYTDVGRAEPYYRRALAIREKALGPDSTDVAQTLYNFAVLYSDAGDFAKAEPLCKRALTIFEKSAGPEHPLTSYPLNLLGGIYKATGRFTEAEDLYKRSVAIKEKTQGQYHPDLAGVLTNQANLYSVMGENDKAIAVQTRANQIYEFNTTLNMTSGSEREKMAFLDTLSQIQDQTLSLTSRTGADSEAAADMAATSILQRKGRVLDAMSESMQALRRRLNKNDQAVIDRLSDVNSKLSALVMSGREGRSDEDYRKLVDQMVTEREKIEDQISRLSAGYYLDDSAISLASIQNAIPDDAALIEFALYRPVSPKTFEFGAETAGGRDKFGAERYVAYVIRRSGNVRWKDLGEAAPIDAAIGELRNALRDPERKDVTDLARRVDAAVMAPIQQFVGNSVHLLISADGQLNLIPFEALVDQNGRYQVESYQITYLTSGRDLLKMRSEQGSKGPPLIIANPAFWASGAESVSDSASRRISGRSITVTRDLSDTYFAPLSGTAEEANAIRKLFPDARVLQGANATKSSLETVSAPSILHIATHGFFLTDKNLAGSGPKGRTATRSVVAAIENPLVRSGLALAGANVRGTASGSGIMSALEASGLDLWGTKLVVLSACDTGIGEVKTGEGVYGLRRSFVQAGAQSLVMSLWAVSDLVTRELMTGYYKNLRNGMGRGESLRQVQLNMLKRPGRRHPFYWASFIQSGNWRPLDERP